MKTTTRLASALAPLALAIGFAGCSPKENATASSAREQELTKEVATLREKLAAAGRDPAKPDGAQTSASARDNDNKTEDTSFVVVKKTFVAGQLIPTPTGANPTATERKAAECRIVFKGEQSGVEYPEIEIKEIAYASFREGGSYTAQEVMQAKKPAAGSDATPAMTTADARSIFGQ